ncbi:Uncharacterised protein [Corynebacterium renale]|uniref:Uncharacterized protein n=1 Tax=Corynebacterium renale TaxID=1724 RepID=A0A2A9DQI3_9CORY|nr:hypothetical protein [Corynebacterium renale]PFG28425.1 hypothetical protein ATK06_1536 [Corynebacterium renale]SQG64982.1 Uncharacterised protein [Corynebacterium renale]SQI26429.1 Uncharacterised protein [Corynebacterium renale]STC96962.1 Uncharacterised protein [Corynebacterium renale]
MKRRLLAATLAFATACSITAPAVAAENTTASGDSAPVVSTEPASDKNSDVETDAQVEGAKKKEDDKSSKKEQGKESSSGSSVPPMSEERKKVCNPLFEKDRKNKELTDQEANELRKCNNERLPEWARLTPEAEMFFTVVQGIFSILYGLVSLGTVILKFDPNAAQAVRNTLASWGVRI